MTGTNSRKKASWFRGIQATIVFRFLPIIILIPTLLAIVTYMVQQKSVVRIAEDHLSSVVALKSRGLDGYFSRSRETLMLLANNDTLKDVNVLYTKGTSKRFERRRRQVVGSIRGFLRSSITDNNEFAEYMILDPYDGRVLISSDLKEEGKIYKSHKFFTHSKQRAFTSNFEIIPGFGEPVVFSAVPIESSAGIQIGVLVARHKMDPIFNVVGELKGSLDSTATFLFNKHYIVLNPEHRAGDQKYYRQIDSEGTERAFLLGMGGGVYLGADGIRMVGSFKAFESLGAALISEETFSKVTQPIYELKENLLLVSIVVTLLALFALILISRQIVRPLSRLSQTVDRFRDGDFTARSEVKTQDEIGILSENFNQMASSLEKLYGSLEDQVKKRTEELVNSLLETEEARSEWEDTFHAMSDSLFIYDEQKYLRRINRNAEEMIGRRESEVRGLSLEEVLPVTPTPDPDGLFPDSRDEAVKSGEKVYRVSHFLKKDSKGHSQGGVFVYRDVTDESRREEEYKDVQTQLIEASKLAAVGTLSAGVAHEFNNFL